jgi:hypothetical protein
MTKFWELKVHDIQADEASVAGEQKPLQQVSYNLEQFINSREAADDKYEHDVFISEVELKECKVTYETDIQ